MNDAFCLLLIDLAAFLSVAPAAQDRPSPKPDRAWIAAARKPAATRPPDARGFRTLDEYLAHLRDRAAPIDRPWYREVRPGLYRLETGNLRSGAAPRYFTRKQLADRFGFRE